MPASGANAGRGEAERGGVRRDLHLRGRAAINSAQLPSWTVGLACKRKPKTSSPTAQASTVRADCFDGARVVTAEDDRQVVRRPFRRSIPAAIALSTGSTEDARTRTPSPPAAAVGSGRSSRTAGSGVEELARPGCGVVCS